MMPPRRSCACGAVARGCTSICRSRRKGLDKLIGEPTNGLKPLTPAHYECAVSGCWGLQELANPVYLKGFLCSALPCIAPYCVPGGIRVVSASAAELPSSKGCSYWF